MPDDSSPWAALAALATVFVPIGVITLAARAARAARAQPQPQLTWLRTADDPLVVGRTYRWSTPTTAPPSAALISRLGSDFDGLRIWSGQAPGGWPADDAQTGRNYFEGRAHSNSISFKADVPVWTTL